MALVVKTGKCGLPTIELLYKYIYPADVLAD